MAGCKCRSYNRPSEDQDESTSGILMPRDVWDRIYPSGRRKYAPIQIDECIQEQMLALWDAGIGTGCSCCGHNGLFGDPRPSVIVWDGDDCAAAHSVLERDDRDWKVLQWRSVLPGSDPVLGRVLKCGTFLEGA